jgi:hypothetical protein
MTNSLDKKFEQKIQTKGFSVRSDKLLNIWAEQTVLFIRQLYPGKEQRQMDIDEARTPMGESGVPDERLRAA